MQQNDEIELTKEQENMIRICTRQFVTSSEFFPTSWSERKDKIIMTYQPVYRIVEQNPLPKIIQRIGNIIVDEWRKQTEF